MSYLEKLQELVNKDDYEKIVKDLGDKHLILNDGNYIPIEKFNAKSDENKALGEQIESLKTNISDTEAKLKELSSLGDVNETLKTQLAELNEKNSNIVAESELKVKTANEEAQKRIQQLAIDSAVKVELIKHGAVNGASQKSVIANLDFEKITQNDKGEILGLDQIKLLQESTPNLFFGEGTPTGTPYVKGSTVTTGENSIEDKIVGIYGD